MSSPPAPAKPAGLWTKALDYVGPSRRLRLQAEGKWIWLADAEAKPPGKAGAPAPSAPSVASAPISVSEPPPPSPESERACGPDGDLESPGTPIGKISGSTGAVKNADAFLVGSYAVIESDEKKQGPLFLTINDVPAGIQGNRGSLRVTIWESF